MISIEKLFLIIFVVGMFFIVSAFLSKLSKKGKKAADLAVVIYMVLIIVIIGGFTWLSHY